MLSKSKTDSTLQTLKINLQFVDCALRIDVRDMRDVRDVRDCAWLCVIVRDVRDVRDCIDFWRVNTPEKRTSSQKQRLAKNSFEKKYISVLERSDKKDK